MARENEHGPASERAARLQRRLQAAEATANGASGTANGATTWQKDVANYATPPRAAASSTKTSTAAVQQHATSPNQGRSTGMAELAGVDPPQGMAELAGTDPPQDATSNIVCANISATDDILCANVSAPSNIVCANISATSNIVCANMGKAARRPEALAPLQRNLKTCRAAGELLPKIAQRCGGA